MIVPAASTIDQRSNFKDLQNLRDSGGIEVSGGNTIRRGLIYRSAAPWQVPEQDLATLVGMGIRHMVDLRTLQEKDAQPDPAIPGIAEHFLMCSARSMPLGRPTCLSNSRMPRPPKKR